MPDERERVADHVPSPELIDRLIRDVWEPLELKVVLTVAALGGGNSPVTERDVISHPALVRGARGDGSDRDSNDRLRTALQSSVARGILMALRDESGLLWFTIASHDARRLASSGTWKITDIGDLEPHTLVLDRPDVFGLYEQNIGVVSPIMADRINEALNAYPEEWIRDAIGEAVTYNKRNWRYIQRILENWTTEGRSHETNRRDNEEHLDPEKYLRGKYATLFRRR